MGGGFTRRLFLSAHHVRAGNIARKFARKIGSISHTVFACGADALGSISSPSQTALQRCGKGERTT